MSYPRSRFELVTRRPRPVRLERDGPRARPPAHARAMGRRGAILCLALALLAGAPAAANERADGIAGLSHRLAGVVDSGVLRRARVAALVVRERDGAVLYEHTPDRALTPASNLKILTALAALSTFGPTHRFETRVTSDAAPDAEGAVGGLWIHGGGDPAMNSEDWWRLASQLRQRGVRRVRGDLVLDDSLFDRKRWHASWGRTSSRAYHAPVGALTANYGAFSVTVEPGAAPGDPVGVVVDPPVPYLRISNTAATRSRSKRTSLIVDRKAGEDVEIVAVRGAVRAGGPPETFHRSVLDPARYAGAVLRMQLESVGIQVDGRVRVDTAAPESSHELLAYHGRPLSEIVRLFVKFSNNAMAESLVKGLGARATGRGSWSSGRLELRRALESLGLDAEGSVLVDGSGLSYENKVSPRTFVAALRAGRRSFDFGPEFLSALPIAAKDGTLERRAEEASGDVRAKTGLLNSITGLSGFARLEDGELAVFSILVNGYRGSDKAAMDAVDAFVGALVGGGDAPTAALLEAPPPMR